MGKETRIFTYAICSGSESEVLSIQAAVPMTVAECSHSGNNIGNCNAHDVSLGYSRITCALKHIRSSRVSLCLRSANVSPPCLLTFVCGHRDAVRQFIPPPRREALGSKPDQYAPRIGCDILTVPCRARTNSLD